MGEGRFRLHCIWQASVLDPLKSMDESNEIDYLALKGERDAGMRRIIYVSTPVPLPHWQELTGSKTSYSFAPAASLAWVAKRCHRQRCLLHPPADAGFRCIILPRRRSSTSSGRSERVACAPRSCCYPFLTCSLFVP